MHARLVRACTDYLAANAQIPSAQITGRVWVSKISEVKCDSRNPGKS